MLHKFILFQRFDGRSLAARVQQGPIRPQFALVQLGPCLHEAPLSQREFTRENIHRVNADNGHLILIISMEMRDVVRRAGLGEHTDYDAEESAEFRHKDILAWAIPVNVA
jgi:hypothetical protein